jgi:hypothetical protein
MRIYCQVDDFDLYFGLWSVAYTVARNERNIIFRANFLKYWSIPFTNKHREYFTFTAVDHSILIVICGREGLFISHS